AILRRCAVSSLSPYTTLFRSVVHGSCALCQAGMNGRQGIHDFGHCGGYAARRRIGSFPGWSPAMSRSLVLLLAGLLSPVSLLARSEEHTSELQSRENLVCRLL